MKKWTVLLSVVVSLGIAAFSVAADTSKMALKVGDSVFVCGCGEKCDCDSMARKAAKCSCNKEMVKAKVTKVEEGKAYVMIDGKERAFKTAGKYACACGEGCDCGYISQKPGKCACGKELKAVK